VLNLKPDFKIQIHIKLSFSKSLLILAAIASIL
jgi:hypothetical protein